MFSNPCGAVFYCGSRGKTLPNYTCSLCFYVCEKVYNLTEYHLYNYTKKNLYLFFYPRIYFESKLKLNTYALKKSWN